MTYCVGLLLQDGMVLLSDTRTNAGLDNISTYRKMFIFENHGERVIAIMTAGSLSITQTTIARLRDAIDAPEANAETSILLAPTMLKVAEIVGNMLASVRSTVEEKLSAMNQGASASMIVAGQRRNGTMRMFLIYPEGNFIEATNDGLKFMDTISKNSLLETLETLPEEVEVDDVIERVILLSKITRARRQIDRGEFHTMDEMKELVKSWQK